MIQVTLCRINLLLGDQSDFVKLEEQNEGRFDATTRIIRGVSALVFVIKLTGKDR